jgi:hypothetical protein
MSLEVDAGIALSAALPGTVPAEEAGVTSDF